MFLANNIKLQKNLNGQFQLPLCQQHLNWQNSEHCSQKTYSETVRRMDKNETHLTEIQTLYFDEIRLTMALKGYIQACSKPKLHTLK